MINDQVHTYFGQLILKEHLKKTKDKECQQEHSIFNTQKKTSTAVVINNKSFHFIYYGNI